MLEAGRNYVPEQEKTPRFQTRISALRGRRPRGEKGFGFYDRGPSEGGGTVGRERRIHKSSDDPRRPFAWWRRAMLGGRPIIGAAFLCAHGPYDSAHSRDGLGSMALSYDDVARTRTRWKGSRRGKAPRGAGEYAEFPRRAVCCRGRAVVSDYLGQHGHSAPGFHHYRPRPRSEQQAARFQALARAAASGNLIKRKDHCSPHAATPVVFSRRPIAARRAHIRANIRRRRYISPALATGNLQSSLRDGQRGPHGPPTAWRKGGNTSKNQRPRACGACRAWWFWTAIAC